MSYNGVGLTTARGSGTNGFVQRNFALVKHRREDNTEIYRSKDEQLKLDLALSRRPNEDILEHERKRGIELKCVEMRDRMEAQGFAMR